MGLYKNKIINHERDISDLQKRKNIVNDKIHLQTKLGIVRQLFPTGNGYGLTVEICTDTWKGTGQLINAFSSNKINENSQVFLHESINGYNAISASASTTTTTTTSAIIVPHLHDSYSSGGYLGDLAGSQ